MNFSLSSIIYRRPKEKNLSFITVAEENLDNVTKLKLAANYNYYKNATRRPGLEFRTKVLWESILRMFLQPVFDGINVSVSISLEFFQSRRWWNLLVSAEYP